MLNLKPLLHHRTVLLSIKLTSHFSKRLHPRVLTKAYASTIPPKITYLYKIRRLWANQQLPDNKIKSPSKHKALLPYLKVFLITDHWILNTGMSRYSQSASRVSLLSLHFSRSWKKPAMSSLAPFLYLITNQRIGKASPLLLLLNSLSYKHHT